MLDLLQKVFAEKLATPEWQEKIHKIVPSYGTKLNDNPEALAEEWAFTNAKLQLAIEPPSLTPSIRILRISIPRQVKSITYRIWHSNQSSSCQIVSKFGFDLAAPRPVFPQTTSCVCSSI